MATPKLFKKNGFSKIQKRVLPFSEKRRLNQNTVSTSLRTWSHIVALICKSKFYVEPPIICKGRFKIVYIYLWKQSLHVGSLKTCQTIAHGFNRKNDVFKLNKPLLVPHRSDREGGSKAFIYLSQNSYCSGELTKVGQAIPQLKNSNARSIAFLIKKQV